MASNPDRRDGTYNDGEGVYHDDSTDPVVVREREEEEGLIERIRNLITRKEGLIERIRKLFTCEEVDDGDCEMPKGEDTKGECKMPDAAWKIADGKMIKLCATISGQMYSANSPSSFKLPPEALKHEVLKVYDNGDLLKDTTPPMAVVKVGATLVLVWCGTRASKRPMDIIIDAAFAPVASKAWYESYPDVRVQGGMLALMEDSLTRSKQDIIEFATEYKIEKLVLTGHSLGGGMAQIAHLYFQGELEKGKSSEWEKLFSQTADFKIETFAFAAPMTTVNVNSKEHESASSNFIERVGSNMTNFIFKMDVVPRAYGFLLYILDVIIFQVESGGAIASLTGVPRFLVRIIAGPIGIADFLEKFLKAAKYKGFRDVMRSFRHIGKIVYYKDLETPKLMKDKGPDCEELGCANPEAKLLFRGSVTVKYVKREMRFKDTDIATLSNMHNFLVGNGVGPGLAYSVAGKGGCM